jgi:hypothetical protein
VKVGHIQAKFTGHFSPHKVPPLAARISLEDDSWRKLETSKLQGYNYRFLCLGGVAARNCWRKLEGPIRGIVQ